VTTSQSDFTPNSQPLPKGSEWLGVSGPSERSHGSDLRVARELGVIDPLDFLGYTRPSFCHDALCIEKPDLDFHTTNKAEIAQCVQVCGRCLVREECLAWALADPTLLGVLGGTDEAARRLMRRARRTTDQTRQESDDASQ
jgi:WhiB family redox-sensing transcriptional regulator